MPNWVYTTVQASGSNDDLNAFLEHAAKTSPFTEADEAPRLFNFHSFITPPVEAVEEYNGTHGFQEGKLIGNTTFNWYEWNNTNWNTKWNACETHIERYTEESAGISFCTAWDAPNPIFFAMAEQFPTLVFHIEYEEEQGWGGSYHFTNGELTDETEYDIPDSHADYVARDRAEFCNCAEERDTEYWFADCPRETANIDSFLTLIVSQ